MHCTKVVLLFACFTKVLGSAIPIWELLTHQEKIGNLTFAFMQLVHLYCKREHIPDCEKMLTLYGVSNILQEDERTLNELDPYHKDTRALLWRRAMNGAFNLPIDQEEANYQVELERDLNTISNIDIDYDISKHFEDYDIDNERYPNAVTVSPPPHFQYASNKDSKVQSRTSKRNVHSSLGRSPQPRSNNINNNNNINNSNQHPSLRKSKSQDSPIISIIPFVRSSQNEAPKSLSHNRARNSVFDARNSPSTFAAQSQANDANTLYIVPAHARNDPILLKILQK